MKFNTSVLLSVIISSVVVTGEEPQDPFLTKSSLRGLKRSSSKSDIPSLDPFTASTEMMKKKKSISKEKLKAFRLDHDLKSDADLGLQAIEEDEGNDKTVLVNGKIYSLNHLVPKEIYKPGATVIIDGNEKSIDSTAASNVFVGKDGDDTIMTTTGKNGEIRTVNIIGPDGSDTYMEAIEPGVLATIDLASLDDHSMTKFAFGDMVIEAEESGAGDDKGGDVRRLKKMPADEQVMVDTERQLQTSSDSCGGSYKVIDLAIAADSSFCRKVLQEGASSAQDAAEAIVARASIFYEGQSVCTKLQISHIETYCDAGQDPYAEGVARNNIGCDGSAGLLQFFQNYWFDNKSEVSRDAAHLLYAEDYPGNTVGCAYVNVLCNSRSGYGVNEMDFTSNVNIRAVVLAHELGHNIGLEHVSSTTNANYIMSSAGEGLYEWSGTSISRIESALNTAVCIGSTGEDDDSGDDSSCVDSPSGWYDSDGPTYSCAWYGQGTNCALYGDSFENFDTTANQACCACGGGSSGGASPTRSPTRAPTRPPTRPPTQPPTRSPTQPPTRSPSSSNSEFIQLKNTGGKCFEGYVLFNNFALARDCRVSDEQLWKIDSDGFIRSKKDPNTCIVGNAGRTSAGTYFIINDCFANDDRFKFFIDPNNSGIIRPLNNPNVCVGNTSFRSLLGFTTNCGRSDSTWIFV